MKNMYVCFSLISIGYERVFVSNYEKIPKKVGRKTGRKRFGQKDTLCVYISVLGCFLKCAWIFSVTRTVDRTVHHNIAADFFEHIVREDLRSNP